MADWLNVLVGDSVLPGDVVNLDLVNAENRTKIVLGPGLQQQADNVVVTKPGVLRSRDPAVMWIDSHQKRYIPARGDNVIGVVIAKAGDTYRVDIGTSEPASLSYLAFEGSTKRNRPDVKVGDLLFAKLLVANKDMEPELVCIDSIGKSSGMGVIKGGGYVIHTSCSLARRILTTQCEVLKRLGKTLPYELAVGMNGRMWINGRSTKETITIANAITSAEYMTDKQIKQMIHSLQNCLAGF